MIVDTWLLTLGGGLKTEPPEPGAADDEEEEGWVLM